MVSISGCKIKHIYLSANNNIAYFFYFCVVILKALYKIPIKPRLFSFILAILFVSAVISTSYATCIYSDKNTDWKLVKNSNDIKAYVEDCPMDAIKKVRVETVVIASLSELVSIIKDAESHNDWVFLNSESKVLDEPDPFHWKYYGRTDAPWPVSDRDCIVETVLTQNPIDYSVRISGFAIPGYKTETDDCVRIRYSNSVWTFNPLGNEMVHVSFELKVDIGGNIPQWLVNMAVSKGPFKTMAGFKKILESGKYQDAKLSFIKEYTH